ncbi:uncharacterized protein V6R79_013712 [Siganus canaliculatus]
MSRNWKAPVMGERSIHLIDDRSAHAPRIGALMLMSPLDGPVPPVPPQAARRFGSTAGRVRTLPVPESDLSHSETGPSEHPAPENPPEVDLDPAAGQREREQQKLQENYQETLNCSLNGVSVPLKGPGPWFAASVWHVNDRAALRHDAMTYPEVSDPCPQLAVANNSERTERRSDR